MENNTPRFTNEVSPQFLRALDQPCHAHEIIAALGEDAAELVRKQHEQRLAHPAVAIHRLATEGSRTREGGVIRKASSETFITLEGGEVVQVACVGDLAEYPDGSSAAILSANGEDQGQVAVVGSRFANGDEIVDTPQDGAYLVERRGLSFSPDDVRMKEV